MAINELSDSEFQLISAYVYKHYGIVLKQDKKELVKSRLNRRLQILGYSSYRKYFDFVSSKEGKDERVEMINALSTNLTFFYREEKHFRFLREKLLPELHLMNRGESFSLRGWCTAASTGEEPYTIAIETLDSLEEIPGCDFKLLATDISTRVLDIAKRGIYDSERLDKITPALKSKFFQRGTSDSSGLFKVKPKVRKVIKFNYLNLVQPFPIHKSLDFIFCRNVMIYFDRETQQQIIDRFVKLLNKGGYLFMGMSEGLSGIKHSLKYVEPSIYQKL
ncbi:MAG: protein-glutamate O-methyltransferase CheR [Planctomycetes bacterium]|nr:protein-glutamate O-methyltransferase CheR [Planctomycetota bacterium]